MFFICTVEKRSQRVHDRNELGLETLSLGVVNMNVTTLGEAFSRSSVGVKFMLPRNHINHELQASESTI